MPFSDGEPPPADVINAWLSVSKTSNKESCVAVHCVAGLGRYVGRLQAAVTSFTLTLTLILFVCRAPVLVAISLIEGGMEPLDAVAYIRKHRRGAINSKQMKFLEEYKSHSSGCCVVM
jgi:protein tyrosine phosphatase type IVA